jgi:hypothetical protein
MHNKINHKRNFKSVGGNSRINIPMNMIEMKDGTKFIFDPKNVNLSYILLNNKMFSFTNNFARIYKVHAYGAPCIDSHELQTYCIVQDNDGDMYGFPMITDTGIAASRYIRKHKEDFQAVHYASLIKTSFQKSLPYSRWVRIARTHDGITGILELTGDIDDDKAWNPVAYMFDRQAEILKIELHAMQEDCVYENYEDEYPYTEWNLSPAGFQKILDNCIFLKDFAY